MQIEDVSIDLESIKNFQKNRRRRKKTYEPVIDFDSSNPQIKHETERQRDLWFHFIIIRLNKKSLVLLGLGFGRRKKIITGEREENTWKLYKFCISHKLYIFGY